MSVEILASKTDELDDLVLEGGDKWRPRARCVGERLFAALSADSRFVGDLAAARALSPRGTDLRLELETPTSGLRLPFELLRVDKAITLSSATS